MRILCLGICDVRDATIFQKKSRAFLGQSISAATTEARPIRLFFPIGKNGDPNPAPFSMSHLILMNTGRIPDPIGQWRDGPEPKIDIVLFLRLFLK